MDYLHNPDTHFTHQPAILFAVCEKYNGNVVLYMYVSTETDDVTAVRVAAAAAVLNEFVQLDWSSYIRTWSQVLM